MIDWLKSQEAICLQNGNQYQADFLNGHILVALSLLEKEKQQITDAFNSELIYDYDQRMCIENDITLAGGDIYYNLKYTEDDK
jgi:hypothetical protein